MLTALLLIYILGIISGFFLALSKKDPKLFWYSFFPVLGTFYASKTFINLLIKGQL